MVPIKALPTGTNVNEWFIQNFMRPFLHHGQQLDPILCIISWYQAREDRLPPIRSPDDDPNNWVQAGQYLSKANPNSGKMFYFEMRYT